MTRKLAPLLALLLALAPELARACAVCGAAADEDQSRLAYLATTIGMSALPLAIFGGFLLWLRAKHRQQNRAHSFRASETRAAVGAESRDHAIRGTRFGAAGRGSPEPK